MEAARPPRAVPPHAGSIQVDAAERRDAVAEALASVRIEGLEPSVEGLALLEAIADGRISTEEARARALARYRK